MAMPWTEYSVVTERMKFITRHQQGEKMTDLCREFGISRKTGYKFLERYSEFGAEGLFDRSRRPEILAQQTSAEIVKLILKAKAEYPTWGAEKILVLLRRRQPKLRLPARSTVHEILFKNGLVSQRKKRTRNWPGASELAMIQSSAPNELWCADFKGQFRLGNKAYCYPLTISDHFARFVLQCEALESTKGDGSAGAFERAFIEYGLPDGILTDNGTPFSSRGLFGFSRLNAWWMRLGIKIYRIEPGCPEQNGRHERMHLTLAQETTRPAAGNILQQQAKFDNFCKVFNNERPHQGLNMKTPSDLYRPSKRVYRRELEDPEYPLHDRILLLDSKGRAYINRTRRCFISEALADQPIGLRAEEDQLWLVSFMNYDLGMINEVDNLFYPFDAPQSS
jgi:transposase InsO family protein